MSASRAAYESDVRELLESGDGADVVLVAGERQLPAHTAVLAARSPVFADTAPQLGDCATDLSVAADKYSVPVLKTRCERQLAEGLTVANAATTAALAVLHCCPQLKSAAVEFVARNPEALASDSWAEVLRSNAEVAVEICRGVAAASKRLLPTCLPSASSENSQIAGCSLADDLGSLLLSGEASDVTLVAGSSRLPAHRAVLSARSPVLARLLRESPDDEVELEGVGEDELEQFLTFLYTGREPLDFLALRLLPAVSDYGLESLKRQCERAAARQLGVENAASAAVLATAHGCLSLRSVAVGFILKHVREVMGSQDWKKMHREHLEAALEICSQVSAAAVSVRNKSEDEMGKQLKEAAKGGSVEDLLSLLASGVDLEVRDEVENTALHWASGKRHTEAVKCLLQAGANVNSRNKWEQTPIHCAAWGNRVDMVGLMLEASANPKKAGFGDIEPILLAAGADRNARDSKGRTALDIVKQINKLRIV